MKTFDELDKRSHFTENFMEKAVLEVAMQLCKQNEKLDAVIELLKPKPGDYGDGRVPMTQEMQEAMNENPLFAAGAPGIVATEGAPIPDVPVTRELPSQHGSTQPQPPRPFFGSKRHRNR